MAAPPSSPTGVTAINAVALPGRDGIFRVTLQFGAVAAIVPSQERAARWLALPGLVNLHAHADRAFSVSSFRPRSFADSLAAAAKARAAFTAEDVRARASRLLENSVRYGVTRIRTHTDVDPIVELRSMQGVAEAREALADKIDVDIIAFSTSRNDLADPAAVSRLRSALAMRPAYLGASLNSASDPARALDILFDLAERHGLPVDLHLDEHLDPAGSLARMVADAAIARGLQGRVTFSHFCVLSVLEPKEAAALIERIARAEITVVALPETNLYLQDRGAGTPRRRGITPIHELIAAGAPVRFGTDNVRDWFFPFGDGDMLATAMFAVTATHLDDDDALLAGICDGRRAIEAGMPADIVLISAATLDEALARQPEDRVVFKQGQQVAGPKI